MIDAERMLGSLVRNAMRGGGRRRGRRRVRGSRGLGGASKGALALGALGVAMAAFEHFSQKQAPAPPAGAGGSAPPLPPLPSRAEPPPLPPLPTTGSTPSADAELEAAEALLLVRAMIAAANADRDLDDEERGRILKALEEADASEEDKDFLRAELDSPVDLATLAAGATAPETAAQVYLASCLAIEIDTPAERDYLDRLAGELGLAPERARELEEMVASEPPPQSQTATT